MSAVASAKGQKGEILVALEVSSLDGSAYHAFHNLTLEADDGTSQIDHLIISRFGIFVVETKNYAGWIFGNEKQPEWTCVLGSNKHRFQNPLRQNYRHVKVLSELLGLNENLFYSIIAFCGNAEFRTPMPANVMTSGYSSYIRGKSAKLIPEPEVEHLVDRFKSLMLPRGENTNRIHLESLRQRHGTAEAGKIHELPRPSSTKSASAPPGQQTPKARHFKQRKASVIAALIAATAMLVAVFILFPNSKQEAKPTVRLDPASKDIVQPDSLASPIEPPPLIQRANNVETRFPGKSDKVLKEEAWKRWYKKPARCERITDGNRVDCANQYIAAKRQFELLYAAGKLN